MKLIPEVGVIYPLFAKKIISFILSTFYIFALSFDITPYL